MDKVFDYIFPAIGITALIAIIGGYFYLTSVPASGLEKSVQIKADEKYLSDNQQAYADCYYTTKSNSDFSVETVTNRLYNGGAPKENLEAIEDAFEDKYINRCDPIITGYEARYTEYQRHKKELAESRLTKLDKLLGKQAEAAKQPSDIFSLYEMHDPKTLQYPTYRDAKMLYSGDEYEQYARQNL